MRGGQPATCTPPAQLTAEAAAEEETEDLEVDVVLGERFLGAEPEYLVKWVGYSEEESAWEPQSALGDCWKRFGRLLEARAGIQSVSGEDALTNLTRFIMQVL